MNNYKVSCIMPCSRPGDFPRAIEVFLSQDYPNKEIIVVGCHSSLLFDHIGYFPEAIHIDFDGTIGAKRNKACGVASGDIVMHFDSDDYYRPDWITKSLNHLIESKADVTGIAKAYFYQPHTKLWLYEYTGRQPYVIGASMCYWKRVWQRNPFPDINESEDAGFLANAGHIIPHNYINGMVAMIHGNNTASHKQTPYMKQLHPSLAVSLLGADYNKYENV